ncbi:hypothetical protein OGX96_19060 [Citrobacter sp. Cpo100]|uniref:hypothetical protein n=1 Tax=Citrobacter sp. Cpo100 TaxID=2985141 RepID=UPI0025755653|nr:hypothetical protein [Citrobacter sp. Cpo100]MDM2823172.1 hypothetical protein [Citrobacter sp. Cpo100]
MIKKLLLTTTLFCSVGVAHADNLNDQVLGKYARDIAHAFQQEAKAEGLTYADCEVTVKLLPRGELEDVNSISGEACDGVERVMRGYLWPEAPDRNYSYAITEIHFRVGNSYGDHHD